MKRFSIRPRLKDFNYKGYYRYFVTICTHNRSPLFQHDTLTKQLIKALRDKSDSFGFKVWTYCFMPDHLHLLLEGRFANSDLKRFVSSYKQHTGYRYKLYVAQGFSPAQLGQLKLWQTSYYDHVLRKDEDILDIARYILNNPTRKKLVKHFLEYKFVGSFEIETDSLMQG